jgi:hypothetical protein
MFHNLVLNNCVIPFFFFSFCKTYQPHESREQHTNSRILTSGDFRGLPVAACPLWTVAAHVMLTVLGNLLMILSPCQPPACIHSCTSSSPTVLYGHLFNLHHRIKDAGDYPDEQGHHLWRLYSICFSIYSL